MVEIVVPVDVDAKAWGLFLPWLRTVHVSDSVGYVQFQKIIDIIGSSRST